MILSPFVGDPRECRGDVVFRPLLGPNLPVLLRKPGQSLNPRFVAWCIMVTRSGGFEFPFCPMTGQ